MTLEISHGLININGVEIDNGGINMRGATGYHNDAIVSFRLGDGQIVNFNDLEIRVLKRLIPLFFDERLFNVLEQAVGDEAALEASIRSSDGT